MNLRGRYGAGPYEVTAKRWWSPKERKMAQLAAQVLVYQAERKRIRPNDLLLFEDRYIKPTWKP